MITHTAETTYEIRFLESLFGKARPENVAIRLWNGTVWPDEKPRRATLVLKHAHALQAMFGSGNENGLAEAYLRDDFDVAGDMEAAIELVDVLSANMSGDWLSLARRYYHLKKLGARSLRAPSMGGRGELAGRMHSPSRDREAVAFHYDVSNEFYRLWLDQRMVYSCAYFESHDATIDEAQTSKLHHLCRKVRLRPRQRVLDIGCGWGGFCIFAAQQYGVQARGVTLSHRQAELADARVTDAALSGDVTIAFRDYRTIEEVEPYDAIVSIGMSEHVGAKQLDEYFRKLARLLKPGGVLLNQAIGKGVRPRVSGGPSFIRKHVFPDSEIPPIPVVVQAAEAAGLEVRDVENLREHYALTLRQWVRRLEANHQAALTHVDEATYRVWRLYMAASAHGFERGHLSVYQVLLAKPDAAGSAHLPLGRQDWYRDVRATA